MQTVAITGSTGLIGSALTKDLHANGFTTLALVRDPARVDDTHVLWRPEKQQIDASPLEGLDAVVHLAGENIASGRWTDEKMRRILQSRVQSTHLLATTLARLERKPRVFLCASAIGYYGDTGDRRTDESEPPGKTFLADVCRQWEDAAQPAAQAGIRTIHLRFAMILTPDGGALRSMLPLFRLGLGGPLGRGRQWISWVALEDAVRALRHLINTPGISGPVNINAPNPVRQKDFAKALGRALHRPAVLPAPAFALRLILGRMADELLLGSSRMLPSRLQNHQFAFRHQDIDKYFEQRIS